MESIKAVLQKNPTFQKMWGSNICSEHNQQNVVFNGEEFCPVCEKEKADADLVLKEQHKHKIAASRTLDNKSIFEDPSIQEATFASYRPFEGEPETVTKKDESLRQLERMKNGETFNLWYNGLPGVGKSHLAFSVLRALNEPGSGRSCLFISVAEMFRLIKNGFGDRSGTYKYTEFYFVELLSSVDFLVLDDLGSEVGSTETDKQASDYVQSILKSVSGSRQQKTTIITTNLSSAQVQEIYDEKLCSRLLKKVTAIKFTQTKDKRIKDLGF